MPAILKDEVDFAEGVYALCIQLGTGRIRWKSEWKTCGDELVHTGVYESKVSFLAPRMHCWYSNSAAYLVAMLISVDILGDSGTGEGSGDSNGGVSADGGVATTVKWLILRRMGEVECCKKNTRPMAGMEASPLACFPCRCCLHLA